MNSPFNIKKTIRLYRYITYIVISAFFVLEDPITSLGRKAFIISCIGLSCIILNYLYAKYLDNKPMIVFLLLIETIFNSFILIPSGGLSSPYIWYSLNTILVTAFVLNKELYCWSNLLVYLISSTWVFSLLNPSSEFWEVLKNESNLILSLILFTGTIQVISRYNKDIQIKNSYLIDINQQLNLANKEIKESINYIMELYQAVHLLTTQSDENNLQYLLLEYALKMTYSKAAFIMQDGKIIKSLGDIINKEEVEQKLFKPMQKIKTSPITVIIDKDKYIIAPVKPNYKTCGFIAVTFPNSLNFNKAKTHNHANIEISNNNFDKYVSEQLTFLSELGTTALEKFELEKINKNLLINEEQNRIANEIHDGVLQNLFSISCGIYGLIIKSPNLSKNIISNELSMLQASLNSAMSELRATIYGYSWNKNGKNNFLTDILNYIDTMKKYHRIDIVFEFSGNHQLISSEQKKILYRIINEAVGNSIRHGKCEYINITLNIKLPDTVLSVVDNGIGFNMDDIEKENKMGLGIHNIRFLVYSISGNVKIDSKPGNGTTMLISFPTKYNMSYRENAI
jgi:NarL family two-component system sensor histidine kinase LiaS